MSRLAASWQLGGFGRQRGKIAVGGRRHRECLFCFGRDGVNRRAQLLYGWIPVPRAYRDPLTSLRSAGLVKALRASFAALRPCG